MYNLKSYNALLKYIKKNYLITFDLNKKNRKTKTCYLKHDVDYSLDHAIEIAKINNKHNCSAIFYIMVESPFYNLEDECNKKKIFKLLKLKQKIGLHAYLGKDLNFKNIKSLKLSILNQFKKLKKATNIKCKNYFSFHNPSSFKKFDFINFKIKNYKNSYSTLNYMKYYSDSNHRYLISEFKKIVNKNEDFTLLIHPFQWIYNSRYMEIVFLKLILSNFKNYLEFLKENRPFKKFFNKRLKNTIIKKMKNNAYNEKKYN